MNISWYGQTCFRIITQKGKDGQVNILIDPPQKESGLRSPKLEADILLFTNPDDERIKESPWSKESFLITGPGEYEIKGVYIEGIPSHRLVSNGPTAHKDNIYTIETEGIKICHLGKLAQGDLTSNQLEKIGEVDILIIPIGGAETIDAKAAVKIMAQIEPRITIPMYYRFPKLKIKLDTIDKFLKFLGIKKLEPLPKLSIKKKDILPEEAKIIVLAP